MSLRALSVCLLIALPASAAAQSSQSISGRVVFVGDEPWVVAQRWNGRTGYVEVRGPNGSTRGELSAPGWLGCAASDEGILIAIAESGPAAVRAAWIPAEGGRPGRPRLFQIPRSGGRESAPVGVAVTTRPEGFAVLWQEASNQNPMALWQTYEARVDASGVLSGSPRELPQARWPIADAAWVNGRYYFLLYYGTGAPERTRLCGVHVNEAGHPEEHPWWATREGLIGEAHLIVAGDRVHAIYRGGQDGGQLLEADVTSGGWGGEVQEPRSHGAIAPHEAYGARGGATVRIERADLRQAR